MSFTADDVREALFRANDRDDSGWPLDDDPDVQSMLIESIQPALESLPSHLHCERVVHALMTQFMMGVAAGLEMRRP